MFQLKDSRDLAQLWNRSLEATVVGRGQIKAGIAASGNTSMETYVNGLLVNDQQLLYSG